MTNMGWDESYGTKVGTPAISWPDHVALVFHEGTPQGILEMKKLIYVRTAFRNEADFQITSFNRLASPLDTPRAGRLIDNDMSVSENYQRLLMQTIDGIYDSSIPDTTTKGEIRDRIIGQVQRAMRKVFPDLVLTGVGGVSSASGGQGTFYFEKGNAKGFLYKNLSAGEKAAFDLILDMVVKSETYDNTIWCIDEPETHLNTRVQGILLETLMELMPPNCQLWLASHSIGFMRKAWEMSKADGESVAFIDMQDVDFDIPVTLVPVQPTREFWARTLDVALGDLAQLVAPEEVVLCEGRPKKGQEDQKAAFDAACYRQIFAREHPHTDFVSVGNSMDASRDRLEVGFAIQALSTGTKLIRLIDRDLRSDEEVTILKDQNIRVLGRRHIESYLLDDDVIRALCISKEQIDRTEEALKIKADGVAESVNRGHDPDDMKSPSGSIYVGLRRLLSLTGAGSTWEAFASGTLAPLLTPNLPVYRELQSDIFVDSEHAA